MPKVRIVKRIGYGDTFPPLEGKKILVFVGSHPKWDEESSILLDTFCEKYNTVVLCDQTSNFRGKHRILSALTASQENPIDKSIFECDVLIHTGCISGDYYTMQAIRTKEVWRIDEDGKIKDKFKKLTHVFIMSEKDFLTHYNEVSKTNCFHNPLPKFKNCIENLTRKIPELPFSNIWIASKICKALPNGSILHLGILNTLRAWNFFETNESISVYCNVGGFGIDGIMSTMIGASLVNPSKLYFAILGDLAFFYDLNSIGNRNIGNNVRIMLVNNGRGVEFHTYKHSASKFGEDTDKYIAAAWHNGNQSHTLVKSIAESLGLEYLSASDKDEFENSYGHFVNPQIGKPMIFEVFTHKADDADVLRLVRTINGESSTMKCKITSFMKESIGKPTAETIRKILKKQ